MVIRDTALDEIIGTAGWSTNVDNGYVDESVPMMDIDGSEHGGEGSPMNVDSDEYCRWGEWIAMGYSGFRWPWPTSSAVGQIDGEGDTVMNLEDPDPDTVMDEATGGSPAENNNGPPMPMSSGAPDRPPPIRFNFSFQSAAPESSEQITNGVPSVPGPHALHAFSVPPRPVASSTASQLDVDSVKPGCQSPGLGLNTLKFRASSQSPPPPKGKAPSKSTSDSQVFFPRPSSPETKRTTPECSHKPGKITTLLDAWAHAFTAVCPEDFRLNDRLYNLVNAMTAYEDAYTQLSTLLVDIRHFEEALSTSPGRLDDPAERQDKAARRLELVRRLYEMIHRRGLEVGGPVQRHEKPTAEVLHKRANARVLVALLRKPVKGSALVARAPRDYRLHKAGSVNRGQWALHRAGYVGPLAIRTPEPPKGPPRGASRPPLGPPYRTGRLTKRRWRTGAEEGSGVLEQPTEDDKPTSRAIQRGELENLLGGH
ncbi:hypothetical protein ACRE_039000 [Hapsidospora chrysogenum ATCC 11550]|uniref:Uncharacterized protein n=1 Tax=Hapsidospora chrysogenum (strain ATCC 11550 / CBS 779.69 / DSM 880 / IAM 14645 / JCM 23072 / IMI 49137) TaxID=857340 RepID=A0A086T7G1_HAPC1|nr:hypothetical protein ACRE_039000 [Hapsidospora chrysogenum ATCC 11550]